MRRSENVEDYAQSKLAISFQAEREWLLLASQVHSF